MPDHPASDLSSHITTQIRTDFHLSLSSAHFSASSSFCRAMASLSWARSNSSSTSWILRFKDATSPSAYTNRDRKGRRERAQVRGQPDNTPPPGRIQGGHGCTSETICIILSDWNVWGFLFHAWFLIHTFLFSLFNLPNVTDFLHVITFILYIPNELRTLNLVR